MLKRKRGTWCDMILMMNRQDIKENVSEGRAELSQMTSLSMTNSASCAVKYYGAAGHGIEEIWMITKGRIPTKFKGWTLYPACTKDRTRLLSSPLGIKDVLKTEKACDGKNFTAKNKLGTSEEQLLKESSGVGIF